MKADVLFCRSALANLVLTALLLAWCAMNHLEIIELRSRIDALDRGTVLTAPHSSLYLQESVVRPTMITSEPLAADHALRNRTSVVPPPMPAFAALFPGPIGVVLDDPRSGLLSARGRRRSVAARAARDAAR